MNSTFSLTLFFVLFFSRIACTQVTPPDSTIVKDTNTYIVVKNDGSKFIGKILSQDAREILLLTNENRKIYIPQHIIKEIKLIDPKKFNIAGEYVGEDKFATRYFITTNGLPIKKGEHYVQWNLFGPDFQFGIGEDLGVGIMTSWFGTPIIGTFKKSFQLGPSSHFAVGGLIGTGSWTLPQWGGFLPFATLSGGDRSRNIAISGGYGLIWQPNQSHNSTKNTETNGRALASIASMIKVSKKISLVFDSFFILPGRSKTEEYQEYIFNPSTNNYELGTVSQTIRYPGLLLLMPGIRWHQEEGKALQFGFTGIYSDGEFVPVPIPMVQWYRNL
ncbi:MAG: hypothetical protein FJZ67_00515 [Bacteroidetes bacterium]|nr:hypothetical protein [Bacteroidota bacterium]